VTTDRIGLELLKSLSVDRRGLENISKFVKEVGRGGVL
jgi:hypothetical protein